MKRYTAIGGRRSDRATHLEEWTEGEWVSYADVLAWRDRIREAVAAERGAADARVRSPHPRPNRCGLCGWSLYDGVAGQNPGCACAWRELADAEKGWRTPDQLSQCNALDALLSGDEGVPDGHA